MSDKLQFVDLVARASAFDSRHDHRLKSVPRFVGRWEKNYVR
jgi:hypothetical protein